MSEPERWLRGPVAGIPGLLQPVAHSLLQSRAEIQAAMAGLSTARLWHRRGSAASAGFHVLHAAGSLDRLMTYARGEQLSASQLAALGAEAEIDASMPGGELAAVFSTAVDRALAQLGTTPEESLLEAREVGRGRLPSTVIGLLFHAAEHTQRHAGQLVTTLWFGA